MSERVNAPVADRELATSRVFDAPRELLFRAWTDPRHLARWWGPKGFTNTFQEFDPIPGGLWRFVMHGPDGRDYKNEHIFADLVRPRRIVLQHVTRPRFQLTAELLEEAGKTRLNWRMVFETAEECARLKGLVVEANEQNLDRLEAELETMAADSGPV